MTKDDVMFTYLDLLGKRFEYGGRGPDAYDCYGLMIETRKRVGLFMPDQYLSFEALPERDAAFSAGAGSYFVQLPVPKPFCLVTFRIHPRFTTHIGMVLEDCVRFIHILRKMRVGIERLDYPHWQKRIAGFWEARPNVAR
jgi:murein DD-endopeptidase